MSLADTIGRLSPVTPTLEPGHVWLAGAGPGNPGLLTLDVVSALGQAEAIVYDALVDPSILKAAAAGAELHFAGKRGGRASVPQEEINALLIKLAQQGKRVLRLKGGDPYIFGRGGEEALALTEAGIPIRVLPGLTSALGALALAGIPATMRGINKAIILATGHAAGSEDDLDWAALARAGQPVIIYMGLKNLERIAGMLMAGGLPGETPAAVIASASTPDERITVAGLADIASHAAAAGMTSPALVVVGGIVSMRARLVPDGRTDTA
jgi:uroporphyrin-III C-methyltransferase